MVNYAGTTGADTYTGTAADDNISGAPGTWSTSPAGVPVFTPSDTDTGDDTLSGGDGNDFIFGFGGNDTIEGGAGADALYGGDGDDTFIYNGIGAAFGEIIDGGAGHDILLATTPGSFLFSDFSFAELSSIEELQFGAYGSVSFSAQQANSQLPSSFQVTGTLGANTVNIHLIGGTFPYPTTLDISNWTFTNWEDIDRTQIQGSSAAEIIIGSSINDFIRGGGGIDTLVGNAGDDLFSVSATPDTGTLIDGGPGNDTLYLAPNNPSNYHLFDLRAASFTSIETLRFSISDNQVDVLMDAEQISPTSISHALLLDKGFPSVLGPSEVTIAISMSTAESLDLSQWQFETNWDPQYDLIHVRGDADDETITGTITKDFIEGRVGLDTISGNAGDDTISGGGGNDILAGDDGNDLLNGGTGKDDISGGNGDDTIFGNGGIDTIRGGSGIDTVDGGKHGDTIYGNDGNDILKGGGGGDVIDGGRNDDTIFGNSGNDILYGGGENDTLYGGGGKDNIYGNVGDDIIHGDAGFDYMWGGTGADTFVFEPGDNADRVKDFTDNVDTIDLTAWGFASVADALSHATEINGHVKFDFSGQPNALANDYLWVENITIAALQDDIIV